MKQLFQEIKWGKYGSSLTTKSTVYGYIQQNKPLAHNRESDKANYEMVNLLQISKDLI